MAQICRWQANELITHTKLNNTVDIVNSMLTNFDKVGSKTEINAEGINVESGTGGFYNTIPWYNETIPASADDYHSKMWDADGEAVVLGWDKNRLITCTAGTYVRNNGIYFPLPFWQTGVHVDGNGTITQPEDNSRYLAQSCKIKLINCLGNTQILDGARVWQKIMVNCRQLFEAPPYDPEFPCVVIPCNGYTPDGNTKEYQVVMEIHNPEWQPTWKRWTYGSGGHFYRPMSRITTSCATDTCAELQYRVEAIATNDTLIWPLPVGQHHANLCIGDVDNERWAQHISTMPDGWTFREKPEGEESCHVQWSSNSANFLHYSTLVNRGGLKFSDYSLNGASSTSNIIYPLMESGVELYGYSRSVCANEISTNIRPGYTFNHCSPVPELQPGTIACWPVKRRLMNYIPETGFWCCAGTSDAGSIKLNVFKPCQNSWQIGFLSEGCIAFEYYSGLTPGGGGEGRDVRVKEHTCVYNWTDVNCTVNGNTTIYTINTVPRILSPLEICGCGYLSIDIPELNDQLKPYYPVLCEHPCCESRIRLCKTNDGMRDIYKPILPQWVLDQSSFPKGLHNATCGRNMTWAEMKGAGPIRISYSTSHGYGITAMMIGDYLTFYID